MGRDSTNNCNLTNAINKVIKNASEEGRDHLNSAESIYILKVTDILLKEYQEVLEDNQ
ncbi:MAG: hypothetical protein OEL77_06640 [Nitrosopumilus sp.]|nr:hypothetical protein [Nitrosopumilus sp.]